MNDFKQKLADWLHRNDIGRIEFYLYCVMAVLAAIWVINWIITAI